MILLLRPTWVGSIALGVCGAAAAGMQPAAQWFDAAGDTQIRRTDCGADGPMNMESVLPDVIHVQFNGWELSVAGENVFDGNVVDSRNARVFRLDIRFFGLVNPPGELFDFFDPFVYGPSPLYGYLDIDVDSPNTGGELDGAAHFRYLANVGRFGGVPEHRIGERAALTSLDVDFEFFSDPQIELSGADFSFVFCGCWQVELVEEGGDGNGVFDAGERWVVQGRFFERAQGYKGASSVFGGSGFGLYDPLTLVLFEHDIPTDITTISLVYALDMQGAAMITGEPVQDIDRDVSNHTSVVEALDDLVEGTCGLVDPVLDELAGDWCRKDPLDYIDISDWEITGIFGTSYESEQDDGLYIWTDVGFEQTFADLNGDEEVDAEDRRLFHEGFFELDGGPLDAGPRFDGVVTIPRPGCDWAIYDLTSDSLIDADDLAIFGSLADFNVDGAVNTVDFVMFLNAFSRGEHAADVTLDNRLNSLDFLAFLRAFDSG